MRLLAAVAILIAFAAPHQAAGAMRVARITHYYSTGEPMATGIMPYVGSAACSYDIPLWSWVSIGSDTYQCLDRGRLGDGSNGYSWVDVYAVPAESLYGAWAYIEVSE